MRFLTLVSAILLSTLLTAGCALTEIESSHEAKSTLDCQNATIECLSTFFSNGDENNLKACVLSAFVKYGTKTCMPCVTKENFFISSKFSPLEYVDLNIPQKTQTCIESCYRTYMNDCDEDTYKECAEKCSVSEVEISNTEDPTEECQNATVECLSHFFSNGNETELKSCVTDAYVKYGTDKCMPCLSKDALFMIDGLSMVEPGPTDIPPKVQVCIEDCYRSYMNDCDETTYKQCAENCSTSSVETSTTEDPTQECQNATVSCLSHFFSNGDESELKSCVQTAYTKYGTYNCMPCLSKHTMLTRDYTPDANTAAPHGLPIPPAAQTCIENCYRTYMNTCNKETYSQCSQHCALPTPTTLPTTGTPTQQCQDATIGCLSHYFTNKNKNELQVCVEVTYTKYGAEVCMPCLHTQLETILAVDSVDVEMMVVGGDDSDEVCIEDCYRGYMNDCDVDVYKQCVGKCGTAVGDDFEVLAVESGESKTEECQADMVSCVRTFYENHNQQEVKVCIEKAIKEYGAQFCVPCVGSDDLFSQALQQQGFLEIFADGIGTKEENCQLGCYRSYLNSCNKAMLMQCFAECSSSTLFDKFLN